MPGKLSGPVPPSYRVGPGDGLLLVLTGDVELAHELTVSREGSVVIPQVGQLNIGGITMEQLTSPWCGSAPTRCSWWAR
ncbi:MAG: polysaccharide biosynthesis/export family protein [Gemmatimonadetes bacterium]|nr:polysaccharide biosynthesis/export family protein [Gemmatimonadota bacterium]